MSVTPLNQSGQTPELLLNQALEKAKGLKSVVICTISKTGAVEVMACAVVSDLCIASIAVGDAARMVMSGRQA